MTRRALAAAGCLLLAGCTGNHEANIEREIRAAQTELREGRLPEAQARLRSCERRWGASASPRSRWRVRLLEADVLLARGETRDALPLLDAPLPAESWAAPLALRRDVLLATAWGRTGRGGAALELLDRAGAEASRLGDARTAREIENVRAPLLWATGRSAGAEAALRRAMESARAERDDYWLSCTLVNTCYLRTHQSRFDEAARYGREAIEAARRANAARFLAAAYGNTSQALARLGEFDRAVEYRREALALQQRTGDRRLFRQSLLEMGSIFALDDRPAEATEWYVRSFDEAQRAADPGEAARAAGNLAECYIDLGRWDDAETWNDRAAAIKRTAGLTASLAHQSLNAASIAAGRDRYGEARRLYRATIAGADGNPGILFDAETGLGAASARAGLSADARGHFENAVQLAESKRDAIAGDEFQIAFLARMMRAWREYVDFLVAAGQTEAALEVAERSRAQVLSEKLRARRAAASPRLSSARLRQMAVRLRCTMLSYWLGPERSYVWIADSAGVRLRRLPARDEIGRMVAAWQQRIENQAGDALETGREAGDRLSALLLAGVRLPPDARLLIVPDGSLHQLNFETLPVAGAARYLLDDATVIVAPSLAVFAAEEAGGIPRPAEALLVGVGRPGEPAYDPLPMAEQEVRTIAALPAERPPVVLLGDAATPAAIRRLDLQRFGLIHFAAHAEANRVSPLDSAVILARGGDESRLYAREIAGMPLQARLVTLSACRTAGARAYSGEGLLGLTWAFLSSGARTVIAGLWPVGDRATASLMEKTYAGLARGLSPAAALHEAKLALRRSPGAWRQPFYWGSFQVYARCGGF